MSKGAPIYGCPASEIGFNTMLKWPSEGGTFQEAVRLLDESLPQRNGEIRTLGLITGGDPGADPNLRHFGLVTGMIHFISPIKLYESDWDKIAEIEKHGKVPGIYGLD